MAHTLSDLKQILVVDDDAAMTTILHDFLKRQGYSVATTSSVEGALSWLKSHPESPDLVLSDIKMGTASGIDLAKRLSVERPSLPVMLFSVFDELEKEALKGGAKIFLKKPFALAELARIVGDELGRKGKNK